MPVFRRRSYWLSSPMPAASPLCSSTPDIWNLTFPSLAIRQTWNVSDGSLLSCPPIREHFWCSRRLSSLLGAVGDEGCFSTVLIVHIEATSEEFGRVQMRPHLDRPRILPALALVAWDHRQPSKDACPPAPPEWAAAVCWALSPQRERERERQICKHNTAEAGCYKREQHRCWQWPLSLSEAGIYAAWRSGDRMPGCRKTQREREEGEKETKQRFETRLAQSSNHTLAPGPGRMC